MVGNDHSSTDESSQNVLSAMEQVQRAVETSAILVESVTQTDDSSTDPCSVFIRKSSSLPQKILSLEHQVRDSPYTADLWLTLITEAAKHDIEYTRDAIKKAFVYFPNAIRLWILSIDLECRLAGIHLSEKSAQKANIDVSAIPIIEKLFGTCLKTVVHPELWKIYILYLKKKGSHIDKTILQKAYEYALNHIGYDPDSGPLWTDYIEFLKSSSTSSQFEEQLKMDQLRKTFQRAIQQPTSTLESIWRDYDAFENSLNKLTAKKILSEQSTIYMTTRSAYKELRHLMESVQRIYMIPNTLLTIKDKEQLTAWLRVIEWEKGNPLHLENDVYYQRVLFSYKMAISSIQCTSELWIDAFLFVSKEGSETAATDMLKQAIRIIPTNLMVNFTLADAYEQSKDLDNSKAIYEELLTTQLEKIEEINREIERLQRESEDHDKMEDNQSLNTITKTRIDSLEKDRDLMHKQHSLVYIQYMRFARRTEGLTLARQIFSRARKLSFCTFQVFVAAGWMEFFVAKEPAIAFKIFELGMKKYASEPLFIQEYMKLLLWNMDDSNARSLFERALQSISQPELQKPFWDMLFEYERDFGFDQGLSQLSSRRLSAFPNEKPWDILIKRTSFLDLDPAMNVDTESSKLPYNSLSMLDWMIQHVDIIIEQRKGRISPILPSRTPTSLVELISNQLPSLDTYTGPMISVDEMISIFGHLSITALQESLRSMSSNLPPPPPSATGIHARKKIRGTT